MNENLKRRAARPPGESGEASGAALPAPPTVDPLPAASPLPAAIRLLPAFLVAAALLWSIASSLWYYPHSLSYFNELVGGPEHGHEHLLDSSIAWGQDLLYLKEWYDAHPEARPFYAAVFSLIDPNDASIACSPPPSGRGAPAQSDFGPCAGCFAVDVNYVHSTAEFGGHGRVAGLANKSDRAAYWYFQRFQPVARIGGSIHIYRLTQGDANQIRREEGLPPLRAEASGEGRTETDRDKQTTNEAAASFRATPMANSSTAPTMDVP